MRSLQYGYLHEADESQLLEAITAAFDLEYLSNG